jgi:predicted transcriptional regulator
VTVKLNGSTRNSLKSLALAKQRAPHFLMKEAIAAAVASLDHYQQTGLHTTLDEVKD